MIIEWSLGKGARTVKYLGVGPHDYQGPHHV
jgi:hypothetical protein